MLPLKEFLSIFDALVNEFRIINDHFEMNANSTTEDYDGVFDRWRQDIQRRFRQVVIDRRWATNQKLILRNTLFFIVRYGKTYNTEVKYLFTEEFRKEFAEQIRNAIDALIETLFRFQLFVLVFKTEHEKINRGEFEKEFLEWKKTLYKKAEVYAVDFLWVDEIEMVERGDQSENDQKVSNRVDLTLSQRDNVQFFVRYDLDNPPPLIKDIQIEQDI
ncbi:hypothetical protein [Thermospira aquatica]|uniref:Uncharacterized protein n=1 Tax=Thermospira aquatica TaxID=2828656 RepID=A0AAX3BA87_9SPIR|nr:hypothetical protein [Thermospira aquatica]URA09164.1 hypothetical protein KDW03_06540 [Thermospira aquatica]